MPEEDKKVQEETPEEVATAKSKGPLLIGIIAAVIFIVGIGAFSIFMGVFSSAPSTDTESHPDSLSDQSAGVTEAHDEENLELSQLEQSIFGDSDIIEADDLDELLEMAEEHQTSKANDDSAAMTDWLESEKEKLAAERADLEALKKTIEAREYQLRQLIAQVSQVESSRIGALAKLYDGMKPAQVAPLIIKLTEEQAVQVLLKMKTASAAKILGALNTERAARISANMITINEEN